MSQFCPANFKRHVCNTARVLAFFFSILVGPSLLLAQEPARLQEQQKALIDKLSNAISNTKWTGSFTVTGIEANPKTESYEIKQAQYQGDDQWLLTARIAYGDRDVTVPIPLEIKWAGRTPVITVDKLTIPPLGTFDARVLMRRGSYAGTWAHGDKGGHLFGKYEKFEQPEPTSGDEKLP